MDQQFERSFQQLKKYVESEGYKGWDPFDGLTSKLFNALPGIKNNKFCRLAWIQFFKRSPVNFRVFAGVPKNYNSKGLALFIVGYYNLYQLDQDQEHLKKISFLGDLLLEQQCKCYTGACWGYYFDWQARAFFQPANTPTVVATSFVVDALLKAAEATGNARYQETALTAAEFVMQDLNITRKEGSEGICFSYSPLDQTQVFNASLLGARLLSRVYALTKVERYKTAAHQAVLFVCNHQQSSGAWAYGNQSFHQWVDSFHTGFNLECIYEYSKYTGDNSFQSHLEKGLTYYLRTFFTPEGLPKYYNNEIYPIDIHAPAQLIVTLVRMQRFEENKALCSKVLKWTIENMQAKNGYFYYQKKRGFSSKIPYMRWAEAWMYYAMSYFKLASEK